MRDLWGVIDEFMRAVARHAALDPTITELVRLRGPRQHNCRLCKSLRESTALDAGGSETLYDELASFQTSALLDERAKSALRYVDGLIWSPAHLDVIARPVLDRREATLLRLE